MQLDPYKNNPSVKVEGYEYYFSTCYEVWMLISPVSGFQSGFGSEASVLRYIREEAKNTIGSYQANSTLRQVS